MTALAALAHHVPGKTVGQTVLAATFRHPAMLAKEALTLDHVTGGRYILGLGAGWHVGEHESFGIDLPPLRERFDRSRRRSGCIEALFSDDGTARARRHARRAAVPPRRGDDGAGPDPAGRSAAVARWPGPARACASRRATPTAGTTRRTSTGPRRASSSAATRSGARARRSGATRPS